MKTYKEIEAEIKAMNKQIEVMNNAISVGIPQSKAHLVFELVGKMFSVSSGYSMGETVDINVNGLRVIRIDQKQEYAKSCKWSAKHGWVILDFTKKDFRTLIEKTEKVTSIRKRLGYESTPNKKELREKLVELHLDVREFVTARVGNSSQVKSNTLIIR